MSRQPRLSVPLLILLIAFLACADEDRTDILGPHQPRAAQAPTYSSLYAAFLGQLGPKEDVIQQLSAAEDISRTPDGLVLLTVYYPEEQREEASTEALSADRLKIEELGGQIEYQYKKVPVLYVAVPEAAIESLVEEARVQGLILSRNGQLHGDFKNYSYWDVTDAGHGFNSTSGTGGLTMRVGVIDTGVECGHPDLPCPPGMSFTPRGPHTEDDCNHGTGVYSVMKAIRGTGYYYPYSYIPTSNVYMYRTDTWQDPSTGRCQPGSGAVAAAVEQAAFVDLVYAISMSISWPDPKPDIELPLQYARAAGVFLVAATGNNGLNQTRYPAGYDYVMGVSGLECAGILWWFFSRTRCSTHLRRWSSSTYGDYVDLAAIAEHVFVDDANGSAVFRNGTSFSAPTVAAAGVLVMVQYFTPDSIRFIDAIRNHLMHTAYTGTPYYNPTHMGAGVLDVEAALALDPCSWQECIWGLEP